MKAWVIIAKSSVKSSFSCLWTTFSALSVLCHCIYYVNCIRYADTFFAPKSDNLSVCTKPAVEKHRFPSSRCFFQIVNYGNRFVTIFSRLKTFSSDIFRETASNPAFFRNGIDKDPKLCYILVVKSFDERHASAVSASERDPFGVRIPAPCPG